MTLEEFKKWLLDNKIKYDELNNCYLFYLNALKDECFCIVVFDNGCSIFKIEQMVFNFNCSTSIKAFHNFQKAKQFIKLLIEE